MNVFEALGLAYRASVGQNIVVILAQPESIRFAVNTVADQAAYISDSVTVTRSNGQESVKVGRGEVVFTFRKSKRTADYKADMVLTDSFAMSDTELGTLQQLVAASGGQVVIR